MRSPGWQSSSRQRAERVEKRTARALPVLRIDRLAMVTPTRSASSVSDIRRSSRTRSRWTRMAMLRVLDRQLGFAAKAGALAEDLGQHENDENGEPGGQAEHLTVDIDAGQDPGGRAPEQVAAEFQRGQHQPDEAQAADVVGVEGIAGGERHEDAPQPADNDQDAGGIEPAREQARGHGGAVGGELLTVVARDVDETLEEFG